MDPWHRRLATIHTAKVKWNYGGESGFWESAEGRFDIEPYGYNHGTTPQYYRLTDNITQKNELLYTVAAAKKAADKIINLGRQ